MAAEAAPAPAPGRRAGRTVLGYLVAAACLLWVFHDVQFPELFRRVGSMNWWWIWAAVLFDVFSYVCQGLRWKFLLQSIGPVSVARSTLAIYAGLFLNEILPMRVGEVLRAYLISKWLSVKFMVVFPSIIVERFFDSLWLALAFGTTVLVVPLPRYLVDAEEILGVGVLVATLLFVFVVLRKGGKAERRDAGRGRLLNIMPSLSDTPM